MKTAIIITISGIVFGGIGFIIGGSNNSPASSASSQPTPPRPSSRPAFSKKTTSPSVARGILRNLDNTSQRSIAANINSILKLNASELKALIAGPDFAVLSGDKHSLFRACFSRLTEIDPSMAMEMAESLNSQQKNTAIRAVFKEWSSQDPEGVTAMAINGAFADHQKLALQHSLLKLALEDPDKALTLAQKHGVTNALTGILTSMAQTDIHGALEQCRSLSSYAQRKTRANIIKQWAIKEPQKAEAYINSLENKTERSQLLVGLIQASNADDAFALLDKNVNTIDANELNSITGNLAKENPEKMMTWLEKLPDGKQKSSLTAKTVEHWFKADESKAIAYYQSLSNSQLQGIISKNLLQRLAYSDPKKVIELQSIMGSPTGSDWSLRSALEKLGKTDTPYAMEYLNTLTDSGQRKHAIKSILEGVADRDPEQALAAAAQLSDPAERDIALSSIYKEIAGKAPQVVAKAFKEQGMQNIGAYKVSDFIYTYAKNNLEEAKSFVDSIEDPLIWDRSISRLLGVWADVDPLEALQFATQQETTEGIGQSMSQISYKLAQIDPQNALKTALAQTDSSISQNMLSSVFSAWVNQDLDGAIQAMQSTPTEKISQSIYSTVANKYAQTNAPEAAQWVNNIQDENAKNNATSSLLNTWTRNDPDAAASWVETLPNGRQRDIAVNSLVYTFDGSDPVYAIEWASTMSNESSSKTLMRNTYTSWKSRDPKAANSWLSSSNLVSDTDKESWQR